MNLHRCTIVSFANILLNVLNGTDAKCAIAVDVTLIPEKQIYIICDNTLVANQAAVYEVLATISEAVIVRVVILVHILKVLEAVGQCFRTFSTF